MEKNKTCRILRCDAQLSYICVYQQPSIGSSNFVSGAVAIETNGTSAGTLFTITKLQKDSHIFVAV